jgi:hypothetical protein
MNLARLDEFFDGPGDVLDGDVWVYTVLVEKVDGLGPEAPQRAVDRRADVVGSAADAGLLAALVEGETELRGNDDVCADRLQCLTDEFLVVERSVDLGADRTTDSCPCSRARAVRP